MFLMVINESQKNYQKFFNRDEEGNSMINGRRLIKDD